MELKWEGMREVNDTTVNIIKPVAAKKHQVVFSSIMDPFIAILVNGIRQQNY